MQQTVVDELMRPAKIRFTRRQTVVKGIDDLWQSDLVEMVPYARMNKNNRYILTVIDCFSKYAWALPVKNKSAEHVTAAMNAVFKQSGRSPSNLQTDNGKEFYNTKFAKLMKAFNINHYSTYTTMKASIVECFNRTLKNMLWKEFHYRGSYSFLKLLPEVVQKYNNSVHRTIKMKPSQVSKKNEDLLLKSVYLIPPRLHRGKLFKVGDHVRISKTKTIFQKGYEGNWTTEVFKVSKVHLNTNPITYTIQDSTGTDILGKFYPHELQSVKYSDVFLIEKVFKRKPGKLYVKYLEMKEKSWIS